jgi:hypothetical protein
MISFSSLIPSPSLSELILRFYLCILLKSPFQRPRPEKNVRPEISFDTQLNPFPDALDVLPTLF